AFVGTRKHDEACGFDFHQKAMHSELDRPLRRVQHQFPVGRNMTTVTPYRISGHEGFPCRYTWLPKAVRGLGNNNSKLFSDEDEAMVELGLGKNMVRSAR